MTNNRFLNPNWTQRKDVLYDLLHNKSLYQYLDKEHLDPDNKITQDEWEDFVHRYSRSCREVFDEEAHECFETFLEVTFCGTKEEN